MSRSSTRTTRSPTRPTSVAAVFTRRPSLPRCYRTPVQNAQSINSETWRKSRPSVDSFL